MAGLNIIEDVQFYYSSNRYSMVQKCMILIVDHHLVVGVVSNVSLNCSRAFSHSVSRSIRNMYSIHQELCPMSRSYAKIL